MTANPHKLSTTLLGANPTLDKAKVLTMKKARRPRGVECPCCSKFVKVYRRKFNSCMARTLVYTYKFFKKNPDKFLDVAHYMLQQLPGWVPSDYGKLVWWGLMEYSGDVADLNTKNSGLYRMTERGVLFVEGSILIPESVLEYRSSVESFSSDMIDIKTSLGEHFNYHELMSLGAS